MNLAVAIIVETQIIVVVCSIVPSKGLIRKRIKKEIFKSTTSLPKTDFQLNVSISSVVA
jgi:hypothetical protein